MIGAGLIEVRGHSLGAFLFANLAAAIRGSPGQVARYACQRSSGTPEGLGAQEKAKLVVLSAKNPRAEKSLFYLAQRSRSTANRAACEV